MADPRVLLVGENNPYQVDPEEAQRYAMYPSPGPSPDSPAGCAGWRLCHLILGMEERAYLRAFERRNLLTQPRWSVPAARAAAQRIRDALAPGERVILLGRRVADAWYGPGQPWDPFTTEARGVLALPHPSGLSRAWNDPLAFGRARAAVAALAPHLRPLLGVREVRHG